MWVMHLSYQCFLDKNIFLGSRKIPNFHVAFGMATVPASGMDRTRKAWEGNGKAPQLC